MALTELLRSIRVWGGRLPTFDVARAPADPIVLFEEWLAAAVESGVAEPHVGVLSTVDEEGLPDARALVLRDLTPEGWWFASSSASPKGRQLATHPVAALTWYWPAQGRQVRVRGRVRIDPAAGRRDFLGRAPIGRAEALVGHQSEPLTDLADLAGALAAAQAGVAEHPDLTAEDWTRYVLRPNEAQFFQASPDRTHVRLGYHRTRDRWTHSLLWP
jgi:pyridoxamine 5'-phosphate oxidase